jgi:phosphatidylinositol 4-kinase
MAPPFPSVSQTIDFGFMFLSSPGGNIGFESEAFKLSDEMIRIMGGSIPSSQFQHFINQGIRTFLAARFWFFIQFYH